MCKARPAKFCGGCVSVLGWLGLVIWSGVIRSFSVFSSGQSGERRCRLRELLSCHHPLHVLCNDLQTAEVLAVARRFFSCQSAVSQYSFAGSGRLRPPLCVQWVSNLLTDARAPKSSNRATLDSNRLRTGWTPYLWKDADIAVVLPRRRFLWPSRFGPFWTGCLSPCRAVGRGHSNDFFKIHPRLRSIVP